MQLEPGAVVDVCAIGGRLVAQVVEVGEGRTKFTIQGSPRVMILGDWVLINDTYCICRG